MLLEIGLYRFPAKNALEISTFPAQVVSSKRGK